MSRMGAGMVVFASALTCSCGSSLEGLSSGGSPSASDDGGTGAGEGGAPVGDGGERNDAGTLTDAAAPVCTSMKFCDDFERDTAVGPWASSDVDNGGVLAIDATVSRSPSRSVRSEAPSGTGPRAFLIKAFPGQLKTGVMSFWMKVPSVARMAQIARLRLEAPQQAGGQLMIETTTEGGVALGEQQYDGINFTGYQRYVLSGWKPDVWQSWTLELDASTTPAKAKVTIDGAVVREEALINSFPQGVLHAHVGVAYVGNGPAIAVHYDDVGISYAP